jgi:exopolysaccharide production protein ExoY
MTMRHGGHGTALGGTRSHSDDRSLPCSIVPASPGGQPRLHLAFPDPERAAMGSGATPMAPAGTPGRRATPPADDSSVRGSAAYEITKRALDVVGSAAGLVAFAPLFVACAVAIKLEDGGPVIYRREIVGYGGRRIFALKFRTMIPDADGYLRRHPDLLAEYMENVKLRRDPRVTRVGALLRRSSFDELPQLVNVLRGEMSLVGPRMIHPSEEARYGEFAAIRRRVRPGLSGLWQVSGRQDVSYAERVGLDRVYLSQRSLWLDLRILGCTVPALLLRRGAY